MEASASPPLDHARLQAGARELGVELSDEMLADFDRYAALLRSWTQRMNLVSKASLAKIESRHILDSLTAALALGETPSGKVVDVGSGAGFPGLPLKIVYSKVELTLVEATQKKARFLEAAVEALGLAEASVVAERAERLGQDPAYREGFDLVLARALAPLPVLAELTLPLCRRGGVVVAYKSPGVEGEVAEARRAIKLLGGAPPQIVEVSAAVTGDPRVLVTIEKRGPTPGKYPRRPGLPAKQPL